PKTTNFGENKSLALFAVECEAEVHFTRSSSRRSVCTPLTKEWYSEKRTDMPGSLSTGAGSDTPPLKRVRLEGEEANRGVSAPAAAGASTSPGDAMESTNSVEKDPAAPSSTPAPGTAAAVSAALLCRWEEIFLADTLRFCLDPAVARAKRVLHLEDLEEELRGEDREGGWSLDSRSFFERLLLSRLNHGTSLAETEGAGADVVAPAPSSSGTSPLAYMIGCYERAVQAGKGPAPRFKGASVGVLRDAAVRQLREVLVTYAILTIQNPDMWGDDDDDPTRSGGGPIAELKGLLRKKGAAALPQGLLDDFIRSTSGGADDDSGGVSLQELFQPLLLSLVKDAAALSARADPMAVVGEFASVVQALAALVAWKPLAGLFASLPDWVPEVACSGKSLEEKSPLGILFAFKASRASFEVGTIDLVVGGAEWSRERKATREESQALGTVLKTCRQSLATVREALVGLLTTLLKAKQAREQVLQWVAAVANHNRGRERDGFHQGFENLPVSSEGMLGNVLWVLLKLCEPFLSVGDPKAEAMGDKTDLDYFRGSDRIDVSDDTELWSESPEDVAEGDAAGSEGTGVSRWLDQRNQSRIAQFEANRVALLASATSSSSSPSQSTGVALGGGGAVDEGAGREEQEEEIDPKTKTFGTTAEFAGLAARLLHVGVGQAQRLFSASNRRMDRWRGARDDSKKQLEEEGETLSAHDKRQLEKRVKQCQTRMEGGALTKLMLQVVDMDPDIVLPSLRFLRFQTSRLVKHASVGRGVSRNANGEPLPPLPMPPPPRFANLPAHLMEDVGDMIKFAAFTCPPDPRSGLSPLELISPMEASGLLSFLVLFIGTSGYMRNPYIRAKMVEALVAFLPEEGSGRGRRAKDPFASLFGGHPVACDHLGPQLLEFFVDIELTGSHTQFYDKFTFRSLTAQLLEHLWTLRPYRESIIRYSQDSANFVRFANMLINDSIYHMDEAVKFLSAIKVAQQVRAADGALSEEDRTAAREEAEHSGRSAKYCLKEAKLLLRMLAYMSESIKDAFMVDELRARIAQMLGYFLDHLVGRKSKGLKVDNMAELGWRPREVLGTLVDVYLSLSACPPFAEAVAGDERSYKREIFLRAADVISKVPSDGSPASEPRVVEAFRAFADTAEAAFVELSQAAEELGDIPDRFMCPIGCDIMRDPVTLPTSGQIMDRQAITRHLLSDAQDPYNRKPLTAEMLEPNDTLRAEIEEWVRQQRDRSKSVGTPSADTADTPPPPPPPPGPGSCTPPAAAVAPEARESSAMETSPR
ncbi:unnamed protein product, partial [Pylaiella littoralis]